MSVNYVIDLNNELLLVNFKPFVFTVEILPLGALCESSYYNY